MRIGGDIERVTGQILTGNFFQVFGIAPAIGRGFGPAEENVAVISNGAWRRRYGSDPKIWAGGQFERAALHGERVLPKDYRSVEGFGISPEFYLPISRTMDGDRNQRNRATLDMVLPAP